jgi:hypothetical protein
MTFLCMRTRTKQPAQRDAVELDRLIRSEEAVVLAEWCYPPMSLYFTYLDGDYWIATGEAPPRRASSCDWTQTEIINELAKADRITRMRITEAPLWHLVAHDP